MNPIKTNPLHRRLLSLMLLLPVTVLAAPDLTAVAGQLKDPRVEIRIAAAEQLATAGASAAEVAPALIAALGDPEVRVRATAAWALGKVRPPAATSAPALITALADHDWTVRHNATLSLEWLGAPAVPFLEKLTADTRADHRLAAASILIRIDKSRASQLASVLVGLLEEPNDETCANAVITLTEHGEARAAGVKRLLALLDRKNQGVQLSAIKAIGSLRDAAGTAVPTLTTLLQPDKPAELRIAAVTALGLIAESPDSWVPAAIRMFVPHRQEKIAAGAQLALAKLGSPAVPHLIRALEDPEVAVRVQVCETLGAIGRPAAAAAPSLARSTEDRSFEIRQKAAYALGQIGVTDAPTRAALQRLAKDPEEVVRVLAQEALAKLDASQR
jgi:HEAT repeat protein